MIKDDNITVIGVLKKEYDGLRAYRKQSKKRIEKLKKKNTKLKTALENQINNNKILNIRNQNLAKQNKKYQEELIKGKKLVQDLIEELRVTGI